MANTKESQSRKRTDINAKIPDDIKEKSYNTKHVDTSITILDCAENDVLLESLLFLSKYADIKLNNLNYLQKKGIMNKLLNLFDRNICILRLALRLLNILLDVEDIMIEIDQDIYDEDILKISNLYIKHTDAHVKQFCVSILSKLAASCRINCLIFKVDLFSPIFQTLKTSKNINLIKPTTELLYVLLNAPAALGILPTMEAFDVKVIMMHLTSEDLQIVELSYKIILRLTNLNIDIYQVMFRHAKLVEKMIQVLMNPAEKQFYNYAIDIIQNCMNSDETNTYFIESIEFLSFCQWVKTCEPEYLLSCAIILEKLTKNNSIKQTLYDLSVEDSILYLLRSLEKNVLNKACEAISNMSIHRYCCERMLTPAVLKILVEMLERKDQEDPENEVALKTIFDFTRRSPRCIDMLYKLEAQTILLNYFRKGTKVASGDSYLRVIEMLYKFAVHPLYQNSVISGTFFENLLKIVKEGNDDASLLCSEMLSYFTECEKFVKIFLNLNGPSILLDKLKITTNPKVFKALLVFVHSSLTEENMIKEFVKQGLVTTLKNLPDLIRSRAPLIDRILNLVYNIHLPLKFFEFGKLQLTDKLSNKFFLINGRWEGPFPFLELLEAQKVCTISTIYVVDYSLVEIASDSDLKNSRKSSEKSQNSVTSYSSCTMNWTAKYGELSSDPFLPKYITYIKNRFSEETILKNKIQIIAEYVDDLLCGPKIEETMSGKIHNFQLHLESLKQRLGTNMIPIGFLRIGFHCERALLFKAIADKVCIPCSLVKGKSKLYWNEVALLDSEYNEAALKFYVVDLIKNVGNLLMVGSREANQYCNLKA